MHYVYTGNVHDRGGGHHALPVMQQPLIVRDWYEIEQYRLTPDGHCPDCHARIAGRFERFSKAFGARRIPVMMKGTI